MNLWLIFLTGLTSGGFTCLALQGGLLATAIASQKFKKQDPINKPEQSKYNQSLALIIFPTLIFLLAKIIAYTALGLLLGLFGSVFKMTITTQVITQFIVGIFMVITALRMWDVHPFFRKFALTPPKQIFKFMRSFAKNGNWFAPFILGLMTIFLPCGTTQAMEVNAIGSGSAISGSLIMFSFVLGTVPFFFILGTLAMKFTNIAEKYIYPIAAFFVLIMGILSIDNGLTLSGSSFTLKGFWQTATSPVSKTSTNVTINNNVQTATIVVNNNGYSPNRLQLKSGIPTTLTFVTNKIYSCSRAIVFPTLKINQMLPETGSTDIQLPAQATGTIPFSCSMGMYRGEIDIN